MSIDYSQMQERIMNTLKSFGTKVTVTFEEGSAKVYGVFCQTEKKNIDPNNPSTTSGLDTLVYLPGDMKRIVKVGDTLTIGTSTYRVSVVVPYKPALVTVAYKCVLEG